MTKTIGYRIKMFAYTLVGLAAFACLLALLVWTITPAGEPADMTTYWMIVTGATALTFLVILPVSTIAVPNLADRWTRTEDTTNCHCEHN